MNSTERWTEKRVAALGIVERGECAYSLSTGTFEPHKVHRWPAFDWLSERGYIEPMYDAEPSGPVLKLVPVALTDKGREAIDA